MSVGVPGAAPKLGVHPPPEGAAGVYVKLRIVPVPAGTG